MKLLVVLALFGYAYGQQCGSEFEGFRGCMRQRNDAPEIKPTPFPGGSVSADVTSCFINSGCQAPKLVSGELASHEEFMGVLIKCSDKVKDSLKGFIQQCMHETSNVGPGFILHPDLIAPLPLAMPNPPPPPPAVVILASTAQVYDDAVCPQGSQESARACLNQVANKFMPYDPSTCKSPIETQFTLAKHCYSQKQCKNLMTPVCKDDIENLRSYLCQCAKTLFPDDSAPAVTQLVNVFKQCITEHTGAAGLQTSAATTFIQYAQRLLTNLVCIKAPDPCNPEPPPQAPGQPQGAGAGFPPQQG